MQHARGTLRYIRKQRRLSQKQVARLIGHCDASMLSRYERALATPPLRTALKLALLYGVPVQEIFAREFALAQQELSTKIKTTPVAQQFPF